MFGPVTRALIRGAGAAAESRWDASAMALIDAWFVLKALRNPLILARRARFRLQTMSTCPIVKSILEMRRRIPDDRSAWLEKVAETHTMHHMDLPKRV
jgi:hypothetical protein